MGQVEKKVLTEEEIKLKAAADKAAAEVVKADPLADFQTIKKLGTYWLANERTPEGKKFAFEKELEAIKKEAKKISGLKAKENQTIIQGGERVTIVKGYPVSDFYAALFAEAQRKQYFVK